MITPTAPQALLPSGLELHPLESRISMRNNCKQAWAIRPLVAPGQSTENEDREKPIAVIEVFPG